ncbi:MAG: HAMP domain-containing sensor histidine kinase [Acidobacteriota bacterium]
MKASGPSARKRHVLRSVHWRIVACQAPLTLALLAGTLYWLEGHVDRVLGETTRRLGRESVALAASAVRHSAAPNAAPTSLALPDDLPQDGSVIEIVNRQRRIVFSSDPALQGRRPRYTDSPCVSCHVAGSARASRETVVVSEPGQIPYQVFAARLRIGPDCGACHPADVLLGMAYLRQPLGPAQGLVRTARASLLLASLVALGLAIWSARQLLSRYSTRVRLPAAGHPPALGTERASGTGNAQPPAPAPAPDAPAETAERLRDSLRQIAQQRDELSTLYFITDQLSRSVQPNLVCRRAAELTTSVLGTTCVLVAGHFHPDSRAFHGTVTYQRPDGSIVENPYPDDGVEAAAPYFSAAIVSRWLRGDLDGVVHIREGATTAYPLERHGRRLGLILAPARGRDESPDGRPTAQNPEVVQVARKHLAIALEMSELQRERLQEERLAAIGQTVAGLSHCMKNTLGGLKGGQYIIERAAVLNDAEKLQKGLSVLSSSVRHIERLTHDMLFYAADRSLVFKPANPNDTMREIAELLDESARSKGVELRTDLDSRIDALPVDAGALYRAVLNLVTNAIDACLESETGRTVTLKSRAEPDAVLLTVLDNGVGIPREHLRRLTERFFTTKGSKGTGLGLPVVQKIAELHGGTLEVESVFGEGSAFHIRIPRPGGGQ